MQNHKEVVEEDKRNKLPANWESRKRQAEWIIQDEAARKEAEDKVLRLTVLVIKSRKLFLTYTVYLIGSLGRRLRTEKIAEY